MQILINKEKINPQIIKFWEKLWIQWYQICLQYFLHCYKLKKKSDPTDFKLIMNSENMRTCYIENAKNEFLYSKMELVMLPHRLNECNLFKWFYSRWFHLSVRFRLADFNWDLSDAYTNSFLSPVPKTDAIDYESLDLTCYFQLYFFTLERS